MHLTDLRSQSKKSEEVNLRLLYFRSEKGRVAKSTILKRRPKVLTVTKLCTYIRPLKHGQSTDLMTTITLSRTHWCAVGPLEQSIAFCSTGLFRILVQNLTQREKELVLVVDIHARLHQDEDLIECKSNSHISLIILDLQNFTLQVISGRRHGARAGFRQSYSRTTGLNQSFKDPDDMGVVPVKSEASQLEKVVTLRPSSRPQGLHGPE